MTDGHIHQQRVDVTRAGYTITIPLVCTLTADGPARRINAAWRDLTGPREGFFF